MVKHDATHFNISESTISFTEGGAYDNASQTHISVFDEIDRQSLTFERHTKANPDKIITGDCKIEVD